MSDISKCDGNGCGIKELCYRFTAPADDRWQAYFAPHPRGRDCSEFDGSRLGFTLTHGTLSPSFNFKRPRPIRYLDPNEETT